jgi:uncharacterized integral membrane protein
MFDNDDSEPAVDSGAGIGTVAAIAGVLIIVALIAANTTRIDINFVVYRTHDVPLWWYTIILVALTIVTDRVLRFVIRHRKANKDKNK